MTRRPLRGCACALVALGVLLAPGVASAQLTAIDGSPLDVYADGVGGVQILVDGDPNGVFFPPTSVDGGQAGRAGLEAVVNDAVVPLGGGVRENVVQPQLIPQPAGSSLLYSEYDLRTSAVPALRVKESLTYRSGTTVVGAFYQLTNISRSALQNVRVGVLADLYVGGDDTGVGQLTGVAPNRLLLGVNPTTGWQTGLMELDPPWSAYQEGGYGTVFSNFETAGGLDNTVDPTVVDNGVGAQWNIGTLAPRASAQVATAWYVGRGGTPAGPPPAPAPPVVPKPGKTVLAVVSRGRVRVRLPGSKRFVELTSLRELPMGTIFDTRKGRVTLTSATDAQGNPQKAWFYRGVFKIGQTGGAKPVTTLTLAGAKPSCARKRTGARASRRKARSRRLWGDGKGRFRTKGRFSSATVRGTKWLVRDTCKGTLTKVVRGSVTVRDFAKRKTVVVKAGRSYFARRPG